MEPEDIDPNTNPMKRIEEDFKKLLHDKFNLNISDIRIIMLNDRTFTKKLEESMLSLLSSNDIESIKLFIDDGLSNIDPSRHEEELLNLYNLVEDIDSPAAEIILRKIAQVTKK